MENLSPLHLEFLELKKQGLKMAEIGQLMGIDRPKAISFEIAAIAPDLLASAQKLGISNRMKEDYAKNKKNDPEYQEKNKANARRYARINKEAIQDRRRDQKREYMHNKYDQDNQYRLKHNARARIRKALKGIQKSASTMELIGCSYEELMAYIEARFLPGMSWDNYAYDGWHIDHIIPLDSFDLSDPEQLKRAAHYSNLQPLWAEDNLRKSNSFPEAA